MLAPVKRMLKLDQTLLPAIESHIRESTLGSPIFLHSSGSQNCPSQDSSEPSQYFPRISKPSRPFSNRSHHYM
ncbi:hypothetical protein D0Y65_019960 [Glycine soja]|uniref:Uncharacterized protein n=1 Tax=Glycine soja TaxID=3848 RepID=A0A445JBX2_GLYSO|nr:hypothetical protein D0Y65_019960 [Glycine soja]